MTNEMPTPSEMNARFDRMTHNEWRRWAARTKKHRAIYIEKVEMSAVFADKMRRILGVRNLDQALGGPVEISESLGGDPVGYDARHLRVSVMLKSIPMPDGGRRYYPRQRHDGKIEPPPDIPPGARIVA